MKIHPRLLVLVLVTILLTACAPAPTALPTATPTPPPISTPTPIPTVTPTATPTLVPTAAWPEISATMQSYLDGYDGYDVVEVDGVQTVAISYNGEAFRVFEEQDGAWVRSYADLAKFVRPDGTFDLESGNVFSFGVEESVDDQGRQVSRINQADYDAYKAAMKRIYESLDPAGLKAADVLYQRSGINTTLTGEKELIIYVNDLPPQIIGGACKDNVCLATLALQGGPITIIYIRSGGVGFIGGSVYLESEEQTLLTVASGRKLGYVDMDFLLSTEAINPDGNFTIKNSENQAALRGWARGLNFSFEDLEAMGGDSYGWVDTKYLKLIQILSKLDQPLPIYDINIAGLQTD